MIKLTVIVFFGSSVYSIPALEALLKKGYRPTVVTTPDKPAGREQKITANPLATFAEQKKLTIHKLEKLDTIPFTQKPFLGICSVYGKIIPKNWIDFFQKGILNIHPSLLPKYRGCSPATAAILNQEKETGITIIKIDEKCDHGPIIFQLKEKIYPDDTAGSLYDRLFSLAAKKLDEIIGQYLAGKLKPKPQNHQQATFTKRLNRKDGYIPAKKLYSDKTDLKRRALSPWPGIYTKIKLNNQEKVLKILKTHLENNKLIIDEVQLEGKRPVSFSQFCSAYGQPFSSSS